MCRVYVTFASLPVARVKKSVGLIWVDCQSSPDAATHSIVIDCYLEQTTKY